MKILAVVTTYYPEKDLLRRNISAYIKDVDKVIIWENTPEKERFQYRFVDDDKVEYYGDGINSISRGLNFSWRYAAENGYDLMLTMDQDSIIENFDVLKAYGCEHFSDQVILGPQLMQAKGGINPVIAERRESIITSGMLIPMRVLERIGGYNPSLVIDGIDTDLCLRANHYGIFSFQVRGCILHQQFGVPLVKYFRGKKYEINSYSPTRLRSILQAHIYLIRKHPNMSLGMRKYICNHYIKGKLIEIILFEDKKISKIYNLFRGVINGLLMKI